MGDVMDFVFKRAYRGSLQAVIFDWAGTTVDYGCFAPVKAFTGAFKNAGIDITEEQARKPMGLQKRDHISKILEMDEVAKKWFDLNKKNYTEEDIDELYKVFIPLQLDVLPGHCEIVPELPDVLLDVKARKLKIGSTTGYNAEMTDIVIKKAAMQGYTPDAIITASDVDQARPYPWMALLNAMKLNTFPMESIVKVGDTIPDIEEGLNAGMWTIGVIDSSSDMGLEPADIVSCEPALLVRKRKQISDKFYQSGAHFVVNNLNELPVILDEIEYRLKSCEKP
jgi:phosphonoacetaldehyde hydrolase